MGIFTRTRDFFAKKKTFTADEFVYAFLRNGGSPEMNVDGTVPKVFEYIVPNGKNIWLRRLTIAAHNSGMNPDNFFGLVALANGLVIEVLDNQDNQLKDFTNSEPIKILMHLSNLAGNDAGNTIDRLGAADDGAAIRWTFEKAGEPIFMREGYKFRITVNDNITGISFLRMMVQGIQVNKF